MLSMKIEAARESMIAKISSHPYLNRCREGSIALDELKRFLVQQGIYSKHFTRYLCALMANLPNNSDVLILAENLFEELGFAPGHDQPHYVMYGEMLGRYGLSVDDGQANASTTELISTMFQLCREKNPSAGLGALYLGAEALVPVMYRAIADGFLQCGVTEDDIEFFLVHIECDDGHSESMRKVMLDIAQRDDAQLDRMIEAGKLAVDARWQFFSALDQHHRDAQAGEPQCLSL